MALGKGIKKLVINMMRRHSVQWKPAGNALKNAFVKKDGRKNLYKCAGCTELFPRKEVHKDHINTVVPLHMAEEEMSLDMYAERLYVGVNDYQILCVECHNTKTAIENTLRAEYSKDLLTKEELYVKLTEQLASAFVSGENPVKSKKERKSKDVKKVQSKKSRTGRGSRTRNPRVSKSDSSTS